MAEIKNSALLDEMLIFAKKLQSDVSTSLTAEKFLLTICLYVSDETNIQDSEKKQILLNQLQTAGVSTEAKLKALIAALRSHIGDASKQNFLDAIYLQKKILEARQHVQNNFEELGPDHVLRDILDNPTNAITTFFQDINGGQTSRVDSGKLAAKEVGRQSSPEGADPKPEQSTAEDSTAPSESDSEKKDERFDPKKKITTLTDKVTELRQNLLEHIFGQDKAVSVFTNGYFQSELLSFTDKFRVRPSAIYLFAGPPGVGKTFLAELAAEALDMPHMRFDMSEYSDKEANIMFAGSDKVYKNGKQGSVTKFVAENPRSILIFDEIEKAHAVVIHLFLQILDAGRLRDNYTEEEISFKDTILIFTTNAGRQLYEQSEFGDYSDLSKKVILKAIQKDVNPITGEPFFPAAICSRFATGNVVMFNHIAAHNLREIAKKEILRHAQNFEKRVGIQVEFEEDVFSSLLFAEGGTADARMIRARAENFVDEELFELFRLVESDKITTNISNIGCIHVGVELPEDNKDITSLYRHDETPKILLFGSDDVVEKCKRLTDCGEILTVDTIEQAMEVLRTQDIKFIINDVSYGLDMQSLRFLNIEDAQSLSRDLIHAVKERYSDLPMYLINSGNYKINDEEKFSFMKQGIRGFLDLDDKAFAETLRTICGYIHQQESISSLMKSNKMITYKTAQSVSSDGTRAEIKLFDFGLETAIDSEDNANVLSNVSKPNVHFSDVIGAEDAKNELRYFVQYLKNPKKYMDTGVRTPRGVILYGPPGTGKTMLAKAMACESDVTFIAAEGNQFLQKYVGEGKELLHDLFRTARKYAPAILFIDEIDSIAMERTGSSEGSASVSDSVVNALLTEMDGFNTDTSKPVFVLAATNFDVTPGSPRSLDAALMRRFDRRVLIDLPNKEERLKYIRIKLASNKAFSPVTENEIENLAVRSTGMSLSALESVTELALRNAIRTGDFKVTDEMLEEAFETNNYGEEKHWNKDLIERVAYHEAGHAYLYWKSGRTPAYLTIVARGNHGGYMQHGDNEEKQLLTREEQIGLIRTSLAGRASEIVHYGSEDGISTGASGDLSSATNYARQYLTRYGMSDEYGMASFKEDEEITPELRKAVNDILKREMEISIEMIREGKEAIKALVEELLEKNHLSEHEIDSILKQHSNN